MWSGLNVSDGQGVILLMNWAFAYCIKHFNHLILWCQECSKQCHSKQCNVYYFALLETKEF